MNVTFQVDDSGFGQALKSIMLSTSKTIPQVLNQRAYNVAFRANRLTPSASRGKVLAKLNSYDTGAVEIVAKKKGGFKRGKKITNRAKFIYRLINRRRGRRGIPGLYGTNMEEAASRLMGMRMKGIGFIRLGWASAMRDLNPFVSFRKSVAGTGKDSAGLDRRKGGRLGYATPATVARPFVDIANRVRIKSKTGLDLVKLGMPALRQAMRDEAKEMERHLASNVRKICGGNVKV